MIGFFLTLFLSVGVVVVLTSNSDLFLKNMWSIKHHRIITEDELRKHNGEDPNLPIWLAFNGKVFDVSKGAKHYGKGGAYSFFAGRDATRAYVTGCFEEHCLTGDLSGLDPSQIHDVQEWEEFYHKDYTFIGVLEKKPKHRE